MSFEWRTEEEQGKDVKPGREPAVTASFSPWLRRFSLLLVGLLLAAGAYFARQQMQERVTEVEAAETEGVLASERLVQQAAANQDLELLKSVLSGRDPGWLTEQYRLLAGGLLLQEAGRSLALQPRPERAIPLSVTFDPELRKAEVVVAQAYTVTESSGRPAAVTLEQTHLYRRGRDRWLLSPPEAGFWGAQGTLRHQYLILSYPERDRETAIRLARDLDTILAEVCGMQDMDCPPSFQLRVRLEQTPDSLLALAEEKTVWETDGDVDLPAPSLIGIPQDEESHQALLRGYARPLVEAAVAELVDYHCCAHVLLYRAMLDWQLYHLGLQAWPTGLEESVLAVDYLERPGQLQALWEIEAIEAATPVELHQAYVAVELMLAPETTSGVTLQRALAEATSMAAWVRSSGDHASLTAFMHSLRRSLFAQIEAGQQPPPFPSEDLLVSCREGAADRLYRYDLANATWTALGDDYSLALSANGHLIRGARFNPHARFLAVWVDGERVEVRPPAGEDFLPAQLWEWEMVDPAEQYMPVYVRSADGDRITLALVNLTTCNDGDCPWLPVPTLPLWSPDGAHLLWEESGQIWRQTREALGRGEATPVGQGRHPFWLGPDHYGYINRSEVFTATVSGSGPHALFPLDSVLGEFEVYEPEDVVDVLPAPNEGGPLALFVDDPTDRQSAVLLVYGAGTDVQEVRLLLAERARRIFAPPLSAFSPDGRRLVLHTSATVGGERGEFLLYDLSTGERAVQALAPWWVQPGFLPAQQYSWSADGRWLARVATHQIDLLAPLETGFYRRYVLPPSGFPGGADCEAVGWGDGD